MTDMTEIIKEYAEALFLIAAEEGKEHEFLEELTECEALFRENPEWRALLVSPTVPISERTAAIDAALAGRMHEYVVSFLKLLSERKRLSALSEALDEYRRLLEMREAVETAHVTSAVPLSETQEEALRAKLERKSGCRVRLECTVDPSILGGMIIEMDGSVMDGSIRHRLHEIKEVMNR